MKALDRERANLVSERTADIWRAHCQRILRTFSPDYRAQGPFSARRIEIRRTLSSGLMVSHSYFVHRKRDYLQGFAVMWSTSGEKSPYSLLRAGTRFYDRPIGEVLAIDGIARPAGLRDVQTWRSNSIELLSRSLEAAERELLPRYVALVQRGAARLARFFRTAAELLARGPRRLPRSFDERAAALDLDPEEMERHRSSACVVSATDILQNREPYSAIPAGLRHAAVALGRLDDLARMSRELSGIARVLGGLS